MKAIIQIFMTAIGFYVGAQTQQPVKISEFLKDKREPTVAEIFADLVHFRDSLGLAPVELDPVQCQAAQLQADWIAITGLFQHKQTILTETGIPVLLPNPSDRGDHVGIVVIAENIHRGWKFLPANIIVNSWAISPAHRANMVRTPTDGERLKVGIAITHFKFNPNEIVVVLTIGESTL
jgi:uncharacterized protein YkwD